VDRQQDPGDRYQVEQATDGSWLVVDRGPDGGKRVAVGQLHSEQQAHLEADTLSQLDNVTSSFDPLEDDLEALLAQTEATIDAEHNYNHLLPPQQP